MTYGIDWTAIGTWGLFGVTASGVYVAWTQLRNLNKSEKLKNTLELLRRYDRDEVPFVHEGETQAITPAVGFARSTAPETLAIFAMYAQTGVRDDADYRLRWQSFAVAANYFKAAGALWERGVLDDALFFGWLAPQVIKIFAVFKEINAMHGQSTPMYGLGDFASAAATFMKKQERLLESPE